MPFPNGKSNILIEQPTYSGITQSCWLANVTALGIARTPRGIDFETLERIFQNGNIKFFYTIPRFHNPLGTSLSNEEKKRLLALALRYDVYIVEDDYLADLETNPKADPLFAFDSEEHVIYLKSFSKTLLPGLRIGMAILPQMLISTFKSFKKAADLNTSILSQGALEIYIRSGMLEKHHQKIKMFYQTRMVSLLTACKTHLPPTVNYVVPKTGFFASMELPYSAQTLVEKAKIENIRLLSVQATMAYLPEFQSDHLIRLSICKTPLHQIEAGIATIAKILNDIPSNSSFAPVEESVLV
jgi:DNA-binding transcriptional MocR family regulator